MFNFKRFFQGKGFSDRGARGQRAGRKGGSRFLGRLRSYLNSYFSYSRRRYQSERGIAIPLVIGMGLLMLLLSVTVIVRSQSSRINSIAQDQSAQAAEVAEAGMSQVQSVFAAYVQLSRISLANIDPANKVTTWTKASAGTSTSCDGAGGGSSVLLTNLLKKDTTTLTDAWANLYNGSSVDSTRRYRILAYDYQPSNSKGVIQTGTITNTGISSIPANSTAAITITIPTYSSLSLSSSSVGYVIYGQIAGISGNLKVTATPNVYEFTPVSSPTATAITYTGTATIPANNFFYPISTVNANNDSGIATLKVEGQVLSGSNVLAKSVLQAKIPVSPGKIDNIPIPGTWPGETFDLKDLGNQNFDGNLLLPCSYRPTPFPVKPPAVDPNSSVFPTGNPNKREIYYSNTPQPKIPAKLGTEADITTRLATTSPLILPIPGLGYDSPTSSYGYLVNASITKENIFVNPNYKVTIYLSGDIGKGSTITYKPAGTPRFNCPTPTTCPATETIKIRNSANSPSVALDNDGILATQTISTASSFVVTPIKISDSTVYSTYLTSTAPSVFGILSNGISGNLTLTGSTYSFTPNTAPTSAQTVPADSTFVPTTSFKNSNFRIFGTGPVGSIICFNGGNSLDAFIFAPNYSFGVAGGATEPGLNGALWVKTIPSPPGCSSNSKKLVFKQGLNWDDLGSAFFPDFLPPTFGGTQTWQKSEVN